MKHTKYYKVVRCSNRSICYHAKLKYKIGLQTTPTIKHSKLFVFDSVAAALNFSNNSDKVYECDVVNPRYPVIRNLPHIFSDLAHICRYWEAIALARKNKKSIKKYINARCCTDVLMLSGTVWCDAVTLTKQIA
jgi:hypothetical protein